MADPLSVTASIIAVIGAAEGVGKVLARINDLRHAPDDLLALINEVSDLRIILGDVEKSVRAVRSIPSPHEQLAHLSTLVYRAKNCLLGLDQLIHYQLVKPDVREIKVSRREWAVAKPTIKKFRQRLLDIRLNLLIQLILLSSSHQSRINLTLEQIYMVTSQRQGAENPPPQQTQLLHQILSSQSELRSLLQVRSVQAENTQPSRNTETYTSEPIWAVKAFVTDNHNPAPLCVRGCSCACHRMRYLKSYEPMRHIFGLLFMGYSGRPWYLKCTESDCRPSPAFAICVTYLFPSWLLAKAVKMVFAKLACNEIKISLKVRNKVPENAEIFRLARLDDVGGLERLFKEKLALPNDTDTMGTTALRLALDAHAWKSCELLLKAGADPHLESFDLSRTPFQLAQEAILVASEDKVMLNTLKRLFPDNHDYTKERGFSSLHKIVLGFSFRNLAEELASHHVDVDTPDSNGRTPLMWAALKGDDAGVGLLLKAGACPNRRAASSETSFLLATQSGSIACVMLLLTAGASPSATNSRKANALHFAAYYHESRELIECLVAAGVDLNAQDSSGATPLHYTISQNSTNKARMVEVSLDLGSNMNLPDIHGVTVLNHTIWSDRPDVTKLLLQRGADYTRINNDGYNILHHAAQYSNLQLLEVMEAAALQDIEPDLRAKDGSTALQIAQRRPNKPERFVESFKSLLDGIRERNAAKTQDRSMGSQAPEGTRSIPETLRFGKLQQSAHIPSWLWTSRDALVRYFAQSLWMAVALSWIVGFSCAGLLYLLLSTERFKALGITV